jgi:site-specific recombinase XerD
LSFNFKSNLAYCDGALNLLGLKSIPTTHDFQRAFALIMLCNGVDIFALQKLMGHSDLQILHPYLAQTDQDIHTAPYISFG